MIHSKTSQFQAYEYESVRRDSSSEAANAGLKEEQEVGMRLMRGPGNPRDRALSALAQHWIEELPAGVRPQSMVAAYPRIANRLALCWSDPALREMLFADLLGSRRRGRRGFPAAVDAELVALLGYAGKDRRAQDPARIL